MEFFLFYCYREWILFGFFIHYTQTKSPLLGLPVSLVNFEFKSVQ